MSKVAVVTDSTSDIPKEIAEQLNITIVPLRVTFGDESFLDDGKEITIDEFYKRIRTSDKLPTTTQPTPNDFIEVYSKLLEENDSVISIHISKKMSGTINSAELAKKQLPGKDIEVVDSQLVHFPLGFLIIKAATLCRKVKLKKKF